MKKIVLALMLCGYGLNKTPLFGAANDGNGSRKRSERSIDYQQVTDDYSDSENGGDENEYVKRQRTQSSALRLKPERQVPEKIKEALGIVLCKAVILGDTYYADLLLKMGADVNEAETYDRIEWVTGTPLGYAVKAGNFELVDLLLNHGADIDYGDEPPLHIAVQHNNLYMVYFLIQKGADVDRGEAWAGITPLQAALKLVRDGRGHPGIVKMLAARTEKSLEAQAILDELKRSNEYLKEAQEEGDERRVKSNEKNILDIKKRLQELNQVKNEINLKQRAFIRMSAAERERFKVLNPQGYAECLESFGLSDDQIYRPVQRDTIELRSSQNIDYQKVTDDYSDTKNRQIPKAIKKALGIGLCEAVILGDTYYADLLLKMGADVNEAETYDYIDFDSYTPLYYAVKAGNFELVDLLLNYGADIDYGYELPLSVAVEENNLYMVYFLIQKGADVHRQDNGEGSSILTPLQTALERVRDGYGHPGIVKMLAARTEKSLEAQAILDELKRSNEYLKEAQEEGDERSVKSNEKNILDIKKQLQALNQLKNEINLQQRAFIRMSPAERERFKVLNPQGYRECLESFGLSDDQIYRPVQPDTIELRPSQNYLQHIDHTSSSSASSSSPVDPRTALREAQDREYEEELRRHQAREAAERAKAQAAEAQRRQEAEELAARQYAVDELPVRCPGVNGCRTAMGAGDEAYVCQKCQKCICPAHYARRNMMGMGNIKQCSQSGECEFQEKIIEIRPPTSSLLDDVAENSFEGVD